MSRQSKQTASEIREMRRIQREKMEAYLTEYGYDFCRGCLTNQPPIDWSHHIGQGKRPDLRADPDNMERMCRAKCHPLVEAGRFDELLNGEEIRSYVELHEPASIELKALELEIKSLRKDAA